MKAIRYCDETFQLGRRWVTHIKQFNRSVKSNFVFFKKEKFLNKLATAEKKLVVVKKEYPSKAIAENVESVLINALRHQLPNSDSGKPSLDFVLPMNPQVNLEVAQLISKDFSECEYAEHIIHN